jgi:ribonuclease HII
MANSRFEIEENYRARGYQCVIGVDEAGRGPLAGPVFAAAFALAGSSAFGPEFHALAQEVRDSKQLAAARRERLFGWLTECEDFFWGCACVSPFGIDRINILEATRLAMARAVRNLSLAAAKKMPLFSLASSCLIIDGSSTIELETDQFPLVKADQTVFSCSAASIIAKVMRDRLMESYDRRYPGYGFSLHKGYPTAKHVAALKNLGVLPVHRKTFAPVSGLCDNS